MTKYNEKKLDIFKYIMYAIVGAFVLYIFLNMALMLIIIASQVIFRYWWGAIPLILILLLLRKRRGKKNGK